jgi:hypothetical protein
MKPRQFRQRTDAPRWDDPGGRTAERSTVGTLGFELTDGRLGEEPRPKLVVADAVGDRLDDAPGLAGQIRRRLVVLKGASIPIGCLTSRFPHGLFILARDRRRRLGACGVHFIPITALTCQFADPMMAALTATRRADDEEARACSFGSEVVCEGLRSRPGDGTEAIVEGRCRLNTSDRAPDPRHRKSPAQAHD